MIKQEQAAQLAEKLKIKAENKETFISALTSDAEVEIQLPEVMTFTPEEIAERDRNLIEPVKTKHYNEGKVNGVEMEIKRMREHLGLDFEGKTMENLLDAYKAKITKESGKEPDKKVVELETEKKTLQDTINQLKAQHQSELGNLSAKLEEQSVNAIIEASLPDGFPAGLTRSDVRMMVRSKFDFKTEEGKIVIYDKAGNVLKDDMQNHRKVEDVVSAFYAERNWKPAKPNGRGGVDEHPGSTETILEFQNIQSADDLEKYCARHGLQPQSDKVLALMEKHMSEEQRRKVFSRQSA